MAYLTAQLVDAYTKANLGKAPDAATTLALDAYATQTQPGGSLTDAQALASTLKLVNGTTAVAIQTYQFFTGTAPSAAGLDFLVDSTTNTTDLNDAYYAKFAQENRFINFSINLATGAGAGATAFAAAYGAGVSYAQTVATAYDKIIGNAAAVAAGVDVSAAVAFLSRQANIDYLTAFVKANTPFTAAADIDLAVKAALIGTVLNAATVSGIGLYAKATTAMINDLSDGVLSTDNVNGVNLFTAYPAAGGVGQTLAFTTGSDALVGGNGNDAITGVYSATATNNTFGALDTLDGGAGIDTLTLTNPDGTVTLPATASVKNVENLVVRSGANAITTDVSAWTGLESVSIEQLGTAAAITVTSKGNATSVSVIGGTTVGITDGATTDKLASVSLNGNTGAATIASDTLTKLSLTSTAADATVTAASGTRALDLTLNGVTGGVVTDAQATSLNVIASGTKSSGVTLTTVKATAVTVAADEALTIADVNLTAAKSITVTGDSLVTISATTDVTALTSITSTGSTGGVKVTPTLGNGVTFSGGAGVDTITLGATTKVITTGEGNDVVTVTAALGTDGTIDAGGGTDTLSLTAAVAETLSGSATFAGKVDGFEKVSLGAVAAATTNTVNMSNLDNIAYVVTAGTGAAGTTEVDTVTFAALTAGQSVTVAGRTVTVTQALTAAQVAQAFTGTTVTGATVTGTLTGFTAGTPAGGAVALTSTTAGNVAAPTITNSGVGTAPPSPSIATTNGTGATTEEAVVTFQAITAGQSITIAGLTVTAAAGDLTAAQVASTFGGTPAGGATTSGALAAWTAAAAVGSTVTFTSSTANTDVANLTATTAGVAAATAATNAETTAGVAGSVLTLNNLAAAATVEVTASVTGTINANLKDATGTADAITLMFNGASNLNNTGSIVVDSGVETVNITTADSTSNANPTAASVANLTASGATKVVVTGNHGVSFAGSTLTNVTSLDSVGVVGTGSASAAATAGAVTFTSAVTNKVVTVTTGMGNDTINLSSVVSTDKASTVSTGAGADTVTGTASADTINVGDGADTVNSTAGLDVITLGAGNDVYALTASTHSVLATAQTITDFSANTKAYTDAFIGATLTVGDRTGDVINLTGLFGGGATGIKVQVASSGADAQTVVQNIATNDGTLTGIVLDSSTGKVYIDFNQDGNVDSVITLTGVTTLTTAAFVTGLPV